MEKYPYAAFRWHRGISLDQINGACPSAFLLLRQTENQGFMEA